MWRSLWNLQDVMIGNILTMLAYVCSNYRCFWLNWLYYFLVLLQPLLALTERISSRVCVCVCMYVYVCIYVCVCVCVCVQVLIEFKQDKDAAIEYLIAEKACGVGSCILIHDDVVIISICVALSLHTTHTTHTNTHTQHTTHAHNTHNTHNTHITQTQRTNRLG